MPRHGKCAASPVSSDVSAIIYRNNFVSLFWIYFCLSPLSASTLLLASVYFSHRSSARRVTATRRTRYTYGWLLCDDQWHLPGHTVQRSPPDMAAHARFPASSGSEQRSWHVRLHNVQFVVY